MSVWDNQQVTSWFVGILEGEGNFRLNKGKYKEVSIPNTDRDIISTCQKFLVENKICFNTYEDAKKTSGGKTIWKIYIRGSDCGALYKLLQDKLECRNGNFQQIMDASETIRETT